MHQPTLSTVHQVAVEYPGWLPSPEELALITICGPVTFVPDTDHEPFDAVAANREYAKEWAARW